jgi:hypothetical protein
MNASDTPLQRLKEIGFRLVGGWSLKGDQPKCTLTDQAKARKVLYAFVSDGTVVYIGKTIQTLQQRMRGYQHPGPTQSTNVKGNKLIREALSANKPVEVYALPDNGLLHYGGFHVNLAAGLEDSLLAMLKPVWNELGSQVGQALRP